MTNLGVAMDNLVYFTLGLGCGLLVALAIARLLGHRMFIINQPREGSMTANRRPSVVRSVVILIVSLLLFGVGVRVGFLTLNDKVECFDQYANDLADSLAPRNAANQELAEADQELNRALVDFLKPGNDQADLADLDAANDAKVEIQDRLAATRAANPYPDPPREVCDG